MPKKKTVVNYDKLRAIDAYDHTDKKRTNNPPIGVAKDERIAEEMATYSFDPNIDPSLEWAGKKEGLSFEVPTSAIHIHESINPAKILKNVETVYTDKKEDSRQGFLFPEFDPVLRMKMRNQALEYYQHGVDWTNRLIAGDSLVIMNSLLEKEGMAGQVQMVYIDPPYGIKYGSNFQPFVNKRDVKDGKDDDLSQEPEMIKAFRDTWELGIHSYLSYLRNRLLLARELLSDTGSVFVQISDENVHHVREICDEVFGKENFCREILFFKTGGLSSKLLDTQGDYLLWYAKNIDLVKYHQLYASKQVGDESAKNYTWLEMPDGTRRGMTKEEKSNPFLLPNDCKVYNPDNLTSQGNPEFEFQHNGKSYKRGWKTNLTGMKNLAKANRIHVAKNSIGYVRYLTDFPFTPITALWLDTGLSSFTNEKIYVVQTGTKSIQRCILMTTDPGDLVLDITCGSGTTAYVAEQWGRRWITCDTSRIALELAKERILTATFDYYKLQHPEQGVASGFVYKTVPHITLKSIANNTPPETETLYDQPEIDKTKVRVSGPFTVESLPAPIVKSLDDIGDVQGAEMTAKQDNWRDEMLATGILGRGGERIRFSRMEPLQGTKFFQAEGETTDGKRAIVCYGSETKVMDARIVSAALDEAGTLFPKPQYVIFAAFQFGPEASQMIDDLKGAGITFLKVQMNTDLMTSDLKKKQSSSQSFWLIGQPDVELVKDKRSKNRYKVVVHGFDYYDVKKGTVESGSSDRIAMWMLDIDYDGLCVEPEQIFFPMGGKSGGWNKLAKTLKAEIDQEAIQAFSGNESLWFEAKPYQPIAVKIIDDRGIESLKILRAGDE